MNDIELREAYSILGLTDDASKEDVDNRYALLLKKQRSERNRTNSNNNQTEESLNYDTVNQAYRRIVQHNKEQASLAFEQKYYTAAHRKWKLDKLDYFWQYNKIRIISALLVLIVIIYGFNTYLDKKAERLALAKLPPANIEIMFYGDFYTENVEQLEQALLDQMPGWQRVIISVTPIPKDPSDPYAVALQQKAMIALMTIKPDMYIMDRAAFEILSSQNALLNAKEWLGAIEPQLTDKQKQFGQSENDTEPQFYGVNVSKNTVFKNKELHGEEQIVGLRFDSRHKESARQLVELFLQKSP
jgi:hypothetical protein